MDIKTYTSNYTNCTITTTEYKLENGGMLRHSVDDKPSRVTRYINSTVVLYSWHSHDELHRTTGPAKIEYSDDSKELAVSWSYWIDGQHLSRKEFATRYLFLYLEEYDGI